MNVEPAYGHVHSPGSHEGRQLHLSNQIADVDRLSYRSVAVGKAGSETGHPILCRVYQLDVLPSSWVGILSRLLARLFLYGEPVASSSPVAVQPWSRT